MDFSPQKNTIENKIGRWAGHWLVGNLLLAMSYFLTGKVGVLLAAPPGYATIVWPASGIALGWILLFGKRLLAGIVLGSFAVNMTVVAKNAGVDIFEVSWTIPLLIAGGAAVQAWLGTRLIQHYLPSFLAFDAPHIVIKTLMLGGTVATLFNAMWSTAILYGFGALRTDLCLQNGLTWWIGDSIGVWIFTPLVLIWGLAPPFYDRVRALIVTVVSCGAFVLAAAAFLLATELEKAERAGSFQVSGERVVGQMRQHFAEYDQFSILLRGFFNSSEFVSRSEFQQFVAEWTKKHPEVQAVEWALLIGEEERVVWQQRVSSEMGLPIHISEKSPNEQLPLVPALERREYLPLEYIEPLPKNQGMLGFDALTHQGSKAFLQQVVAYGNPMLSPPRKLIQSTIQRPAALLYTPVYKKPIPAHPTWADVQGFVVVVLKSDEVLASLTKDIIPSGQSVLVTDKKTGMVLYGHRPNENLFNIAQQMGLSYTSTFNVGQQVWRVEMWPMTQKIATYSSWLTWMVLIIGLIGTSIAVSYTLVSTGHYQYLEHEVAQQTQILRLQNAELAAARIEADRANAAKGLFLANMSHEIRTPMNGVLGMTDLLQTTELNVQQQQFVQVLHLSGKALLHIINDILDYSKVEAGKMEIEHLDMDLETLLLECASIFALTAEEKNIDFLAFIETNAPVFIQSDPTRLRQILLNLLSNAFKFTHHGHIHLRVQTQLVQGQSNIQFVVSDTGIGMTKEQKDRLFQAFTQADSSTTRQFGGTGLGLSISKRLVDLMHGQMTVESHIGEGTTFTVTLPYQSASQDYIHDHARSSALLTGVRVLLVDHSLEFTTVMSKQARAWGMFADTAQDGEQALALMNQAYQQGQPYDVVVLDASLTPMTGLDIAQKMANTPELAGSQRILFTTMRTLVDKQMQLTAGLQAMQKPSSSNALRDVFLTVLGEQKKSSFINHAYQDNEDALQTLKNKHVLIAEDNVVNQMVIVGMLKKLGMTTEVASHGLDALTLYVNSPLAYDLVLMDCEMPILDGYQATEKMRAFEQKQHLRPIHIVALTAHAMREQQQRCLDVGMNDFLAKPLAFARLEHVLVQHLSKRSIL
ncbi:response regulator [Moraxellaceae bacterium AER2_44_116]|nr:response regulator [Moraxellaceae bacterium]TQC98504.1 response regulator [Moraxellaceae bacterium AER2_44_116]